MQRLEVSGAVRPIYGSLGVKRLIKGLQYYTDNQANSVTVKNLNHSNMTLGL